MNFTPNKLRKIRILPFLLIIPLLNAKAFALVGNEGYLEKPSKFELERMAPRTDIEMLSTNLAGENISLADGGLSFSASDFSIPLNMAVNASISRSYSRLSGRNDRQASEFGDWQLDLPRIESTYLQGDNRETPNHVPATACSQALEPGGIKAAGNKYVNQHEYWNGATLTIPGQGGGKLLANYNSGFYGTTDNMSVDCGEDSSGNEYFIVKTPKGLTYTLKQRRTILGESIRRANRSAGRGLILYLVTNIEDRFGNKLNYQYQGNGLLQYIKQTPKNGAQETLITLTYTNDRVKSITSFGKTWRYEYSGRNLSKVIRPDDKFWHYEFPSFLLYSPNIDLNSTNNITAAKDCDYVLNNGGTGLMRVTHPYGAVAEFDYALQVHGRTEVPAMDMRRVSSSNNDPSYNVNSCYATLAVTNKRLTINNDVTYNWQYQFANNGQHWNIVGWDATKWAQSTTPAYSKFNSSDFYGGQKSSACLNNTECSQLPTNLGYEPFDLRVLTVTEPNNSVIKYYISKRWDHTDGKVVATQWFKNINGTLVKTEVKTYTLGTSEGDSGITDPVKTTNLIPISRQVLDDSSVTIVNGNTYTQSYDAYNDYGGLLQSHSYNSFNNNVRHAKQTYQQDTSNWLLNLPRQKSISSNGSSWTTYKENTYHSTSGSYKSSPYETKIMGRVATRNSQYHTDGNLKKVDYIGTGRYELFEDYKRGKARKVTLPCQKTNSCNTANGSTSNTVIAKLIVNSNGTVDKSTDFKGYATNYDYNSVGWLTKIDPADSKWSNTSITYAVVTAANDGLSGSGAKVGQLKQTISQGSSEKLTYFDGMLRPYLSRTRDTSNSSTTSYQRSEYDYKNQTTFSSFPSSAITISAGMRSVYDELGRKTSDTRTTDNAATRYNYLSNNRLTVTDPKGNPTTTTFLAYGSPSQSKAINISSPESVTTSINYNLFGQIKSITQGGFTESRYYDNYQQLCKTHRLDTGITAFGYNIAGQMTWQAEGASGTTNTCDTGQATQKASFLYNNHGEVSNINYSDGSPNKVYNYDESGQLETLTAGSTVWNYQYNSLGLVEKQTLAIGSKSFVIDPEYNNLGHMKSLKYPSGRVVDFAPNALGQATKAGIYAESAKYYANGSLDSFTYGNDLTYKRSLNSEQQPYELSIKQGSSYKSRQRYLYDDNNNVDYIYDFIDRTYDINLGYDGLDRLVSGSGKWGAGSFSYDDLGNLLTKKLGSQSLTYHYNATNNRLDSVSGSLANSFQYDARGNVRNNGRYGLIFNRANQLTNANGNTYTYDGHNRLVKKVSNGKTTYSVYGTDGTLYYREDSQLKKNDYIRLGSELVAKDNSVISAPPVATPISTSPTLSGYFDYNQFGTNYFRVSWQSSGMSNITHFELYKSGDAVAPPSECPKGYICNEFTTIKISGEWVRAYSGSNLSTLISALSDTIDVKARACNSLGCGPYSTIKTLTSTPANW
ncbi:MAG: hypothetical protein ACI9C0_000815 [Alteromonadaceae bacterium]|jgi:hypothetical protein